MPQGIFHYQTKSTYSKLFQFSYIQISNYGIDSIRFKCVTIIFYSRFNNQGHFYDQEEEETTDSDNHAHVFVPHLILNSSQQVQ